jgi:hypothetical protein
MSDQDGVAEGEIFIGASHARANSNSNSSFSGPKHVSVLSKIINIANANSDTPLSAVPTGIYDFAKFRFSAAQHQNSKNGVNDAIIDHIVFNVNATNVAMSTGFLVFNEADQTRWRDCLTYNAVNQRQIFAPSGTGQASGSLLVKCTNLDASPVDTEIDSGKDIVLVLQGDIINPVADGTNTSTLQGSLQNFDSIQYGSFWIGPNDSHIEWIDRDGGGGPVFTWIESSETVISSTTYQS